MRDIELSVTLGVPVVKALQQAFRLVSEQPDVRVILEYETLCSSGKFFVTSKSSYEAQAAAFHRAQHQVGALNKAVVIGP